MASYLDRAKKFALYRKHGILPLNEGEGDNGVLVVTEEVEGAGLDMGLVDKLIHQAAL